MIEIIQNILALFISFSVIVLLTFLGIKIADSLKTKSAFLVCIIMVMYVSVILGILLYFID